MKISGLNIGKSLKKLRGREAGDVRGKVHNTEFGRGGFTLIELLLAITIFMVFMTVVTSAFLDIIRAQKTANETRLIYSELRGFVDYVNNELREGKIDYFCYQQNIIGNLDYSASSLVRCVDGAELTLGAGNNLRTISADGLSSSIIKFDAETQAVCLKRYRSVNESWQPEEGYYETGSDDECGDGYKTFAFSNLKVKNLRFEILPVADPSAPSSQSNLATQLKPMVWMFLQVGSKSDTVKFDLNYQTLITARN